MSLRLSLSVAVLAVLSSCGERDYLIDDDADGGNGGACGQSETGTEGSTESGTDEGGEGTDGGDEDGCEGEGTEDGGDRVPEDQSRARSKPAGPRSAVNSRPPPEIRPHGT